MRIVIDLQGAQGASRHRGIGRHSLSLALAIARQRGDHEVVLALNGLFPETIEPIRAAFDGVLPQDNIHVWDAPGSVSFISREGSRRRLTAELLREAFIARLEPDLCYVTSLFEGFSDDALTSIGRFADAFPTAVTLYDLIPLIHRERLMTDPRGRVWYDEKLGYLRRASLLLAISESSRQEGLGLLGSPPQAIVTARCAADERFRPLNLDPKVRADLLRRHGLSASFVMYTGGDDIRKNMDGLVRAYAWLPAKLRKRHQLAIVCQLPDARRQELMTLALSQGLAPNELALTGKVSDEDLTLLYNACTLFVFPSWHEGFGLPALEAMSCGAPVIGSNTTSIPEVIGRADALFDPLSDQSIAAKLAEVLADDSLRASFARHGLQQARTFSWDASACDAISAFEHVHAARRSSPSVSKPAARRRRLAYVSPWPPDRSGIADYSAELLPALARHYDIELIASKARANKPSSDSELPLHGPDWLRANASRFDLVLYQFGNSAFHGFMFDLLADVPGAVVLHDFFLSGFLSDSERYAKGGPVWTRALYESHGYAAVRERFTASDPADVVLKYPTNLDVVRQALGVIVHSDHAQRLAKQWYGADIGPDWAVVPHARAPAAASDRKAARAALGLPDDIFLVCCFGHLGELKLNDRLLAAWLKSSLFADERCQLVFVGECPTNRYGRSFQSAMQASGAGDRIRIAGWTAPDDYRRYLAAADAAVQLRAHSRGETSGSVLDCMNHGLPTIVNACGAMAELPADAVVTLPEVFEDAALAAALEKLRHDDDLRAALDARARAVIRTQHDPDACADAYADAIERFHARAHTGVPRLIKAIAAQDIVPKKAERKPLAAAIACNHPALRPARRLFVDVSELVRRDARSGVQRVARNVLRALLSNPPEGFRVEPVYAIVNANGHRYARNFTLRLNECAGNWIEDDPVDPQAGDIFLGLDLNQEVTAAQAGPLEAYRARGVRVFHVIHDLLPVLRPDFFPADMSEAHARWLNTVARYDGVIAVSRAVADEFLLWLAAHGPERLRPLGIAWWHLGADLDAVAPARDRPPGAERELTRLKAAPTLVIVGTLEPRKGHALALSAFERLWSSGADINLALVGRPGWMVDELVTRIEHHPELGKRLFWLNGIGDDHLDAVYAASACLLAPSEGEGFGLPLIEAARHRLPILGRDIAVFREVAGDHAAYFNARDPDELATAIGNWLSMFRRSEHPRSDAMPWLTWQESTRNLLDIVLQDRWPIKWPSPANREMECRGELDGR